MPVTPIEQLREWHPEFTAIRRDIHAHPELGMEEHRTAALVAEKLRGWGVDVTQGVGNTGVVGTVQGKRPGQRTIGLRADMDALGLTEQTGLPYASTVPGKMHACGHDGHTTMLLAAARYLAQERDFAGTVHFIFQPAEEGRGGAVAMLNDGLFERFPCDSIYGLHCWPGMQLGEIGMGTGAMMAGGGSWEVAFTGTGGHGGATPHLATDVTVVAGHFLLAVQTIVARNIAPADTAVVSVGYVLGGTDGVGNVMPSSIRIGGTARYFRQELCDVIAGRLRALADSLAAAHGCQAGTVVEWKFRPLVNQPGQIEVASAAARPVFGPSAVHTHWPATTGSEDFADMLMVRPGAFAFLGNGVNADGPTHLVHTPLFNFNDEAIPLGAAYWVGLVREELGLQS